MDFKSLNMQPVVVLQKLSESDIKFYTRRAPNRRSGRRKRELTYNLKDEQRVDFSYFEEYRRSRTSYIKRKERKKKSSNKSRSSTSKSVTESKVSAQATDFPASNLLQSLVLGTNEVNKVKPETSRKKKKKSDSSIKPVKKNKKFKRMVIESDSDCSVENYGIVYSNEGNVPFSSNGQTESVSNSFSQNSFSPNSLLFNNVIQTNVSCSPNISPPCSEVIVNEDDILSALDCEPADEFYKVIKDKFPKLEKYKRLDSSDLLDYLSGSSRDGNELTSEQYKSNLETGLTVNLSQDCSKFINFSTNSTTSNDNIMKNKGGSDDVIKVSCDIVSKIIQDMDQNYQKRKKAGANLQNMELVSGKPSNSKVLPSVSNNVLSKEPCNLSSSQHSKEFGNSATQDKVERNKFTMSSIKRKNIDRRTYFLSGVHPEVSAVVQCLVKDVCRSLSQLNRNSCGVNNKRVAKLIKSCFHCHGAFVQKGNNGENLCIKCRALLSPKVDATLARNESSLVVKKKVKTVKKFKSSRSIKSLNERLSPLKIRKPSYLKNVRHEIVKHLSVEDRRRLMYRKKKGVMKHHVKTNIAKLCAKSLINPSNKLISEFNETSTTSAKNRDIAGENECNSNESKSAEISCKELAEPKITKTDVRQESVSKRRIKVLKFREGKRDFSKDPCSKRNKKRGTVVGNKNETTKHNNMPVSKETENQATSEKSHFTVTSIKDGLYLMTLSEPDKELDMSSEIPDIVDKVKNKSDIPSETKEVKIPDVKENTEEYSKPSMQLVMHNQEAKQIQDIQYRYLLPTCPVVIVATRYTKADQQSSDFHLSSVHYEQSGQYKPALSQGSEFLPVAENVCDKANNNTAVSEESSSQIFLPHDSPENEPVLTEPALAAASPISSNAVVKYTDMENASGSVFSDNNLHSSSHSYASASATPQQIGTEKKIASSTVLHELDAIAILSILDLDGNEHHANALLDNLLMRELEELQKIKELCHETLEDELKNLAAMKSQAKLGRIKSLNIARGLLKEYGQLSKIVDAVLKKPPSETSVSSHEVNSVPHDQHLAADFVNVPKLEKTDVLSNCCLQQAVTTENKSPSLQSSSDSPLYRQGSVGDHNLRPEISHSKTSLPNISIKSETSEASSSCMLSGLSSTLPLTNSNEEYVSSALSQVTLSQLAVTTPNIHQPISAESLAVSSSVIKSGSSYFRPNQAFSQVNTALPSSSLYQTDMLNTPLNTVPPHPANSTSVIVESAMNVKGETEETRSSCQLQNQSQSANLNPINFPPCSPVDQQLNSIVSSRMEQPSTVIQYRPILPANTVPKSNNFPCPNRTVPFTLANQVVPSVNRSLIPMTFAGSNKGMLNSSSNITSNPLRVQQVVLSNVQAMSNEHQNRYSVAPYNYIMPQQSVANSQLITTQPLQNVYAIYPPASGNSQVACQPNAPTKLQPAGIATTTSQIINVVPSNAVEPLMSCVVCKKNATMRCKQCAKVVYCNTECAKIYWHQRHKMECRPGVT